MIKPYQLLVLCLFAFCILDLADSNKYSKKSNEDFEKREYKKEKSHDKSEYKQKYDGKKKEYDPRRQENDHIYEKKSHDLIEDPNADLRKINKPFRMSKLNHLWTKAQSRLTEPKLKSIYAELKIHDKEEIALKKIKHEGNDKDGLLEAELRRKLLTLMNNYGLTEHAAEVQDPGRKQGVEPFTEKKLNKLWIQAESSGFTAEELQILKEEFLHHQQKLDEYYAILNDVGERTKNNAVNSVDDKHERFNELSQLENNDPVVNEYLTKVNELRDKHKELREDYDRLYRMAMVGAKNQEFTEPRVQGLWKIALKANFTTEELDSIRTELIHYEKRLLKLRRLHVEAVMEDEQRKSRGIEKIPGLEMTDDLIKKQSRKVAKMHLDIETRIMERHTEL